MSISQRTQHKINNFFNLISNESGFFIEPLKKIKYVCEKFLSNNPDFSETKFKIKISADGTNLSKKNVKLLNFTFCLLDDKANAMNVNGCYCLGIIFLVIVLKKNIGINNFILKECLK